MIIAPNYAPLYSDRDHLRKVCLGGQLSRSFNTTIGFSRLFLIRADSLIEAVRLQVGSGLNAYLLDAPGGAPLSFWWLHLVKA